MIKVLIVDDEHLLRKHIRCSIDWSSLNMQVVGEASDGNEALLLIERECPDIVLTDIRMPDMNGIQLAGIIRDRYQKTLVIIITGYGEFEYAKEAINANVFGYLLKPIHQTEYTLMLKNAGIRIMEQRRELEIAGQIEVYQSTQSRIYNLKRVIAEPHTKEDVADFLRKANVDISENNLSVIVIKWETLGHSMADTQYRDDARKALETQLNNCVFSGLKHVAFENAPDELVVYCTLNAVLQNTVASKMEQFCISLEVARDFKMFVGMSCIGDGYDCLQSLYLQAKKALKSIFVLANCKVLIYNEGNAHTTGLLSQYFDSNELMKNLRQNDMSIISEYIESIYDEMAQQCVTKEACVFTSLMMLSVLNKYLMENNRSLEYYTNELVDIVSSKETLMELKAFVLMLFEKSLEEFLEAGKRFTHEKVAQAQAYIADHYSDEDLSLNTVARALYINASYLCSLFKRETNMTIVESIKNYRLGIAKEMFDEKADITISEVARTVGYSDEYYFMRCFKKKYGVSPKTYKRMKTQME